MKSIITRAVISPDGLKICYGKEDGNIYIIILLNNSLYNINIYQIRNYTNSGVIDIIWNSDSSVIIISHEDNSIWFKNIEKTGVRYRMDKMDRTDKWNIFEDTVDIDEIDNILGVISTVDKGYIIKGDVGTDTSKGEISREDVGKDIGKEDISKEDTINHTENSCIDDNTNNTVDTHRSLIGEGLDMFQSIIRDDTLNSGHASISKSLISSHKTSNPAIINAIGNGICANLDTSIEHSEPNEQSNENYYIQTPHESPIYKLLLNNQETLLITGSFDSSICIYNLILGKLIKILNGHSKPIYSIKMSNNDKYIFSCSEDGYICIWSIDLLCCIKKININFKPINLFLINNYNYLIGLKLINNLIILIHWKNNTIHRMNHFNTSDRNIDGLNGELNSKNIEDFANTSDIAGLNNKRYITEVFYHNNIIIWNGEGGNVRVDNIINNNRYIIKYNINRDDDMSTSGHSDNDMSDDMNSNDISLSFNSEFSTERNDELNEESSEISFNREFNIEEEERDEECQGISYSERRSIVVRLVDGKIDWFSIKNIIKG
eukprot:GHVP01059450.1.p1 GENE.GHVP01059450.1~~GHVP01059450.1.p1  ORF type:complete len:548 (+),score=49.89 GHVP01059450.1:1316-2959(+)